MSAPRWWCPVRRVARAATLAALVGLGTPRLVGAQETTVDSALAYLDSVHATVRRTHWDTASVGAGFDATWRRLRDTLATRPSVTAARGSAAALLASLGTSHFSILPGSLAPGEPFGEGMLRITVRVAYPYVLISDVPPASRAWNAGLRAGQLLETIRGVPMARVLAPLAGLPPRARDTYGPGAVQRALTGEIGSPIRVGVREVTGEFKELFVPREAPPGELLQFPGLPPQHAQFEAWTLRHDGMTIGAIRFTPWLPQLVARIDSAVDRMRGADAIILDLRGNPGGTALMASGVAGHFVDDTLLLAVMRTRTNALRYRANPRRVNPAAQVVRPFAGPLVLVLDAGSASTTELFAGGLQRAGRALVVGDTSAGMALPATTTPLFWGDRLLHAIADMRLADGTSLEGRGVVPDLVVGLDRRRLALGQDPEFLVAVALAATRARQARGLPPLARPAPPAVTGPVPSGVTPAARTASPTR